MDTTSFDDIFRRFQSVTGTSTQQELADVLGIKQSTLKYHTGNMYTKLGVSSRKQLLNLAALYADRQKRQQDAQPY